MTTQLHLLDSIWVRAQAPVVLAAMAGKEFTADEIHKVVTEEPEQVNHYGALVAKLRCEGKIERIGYRPSQRVSANRRVVAVWRVKAIWAYQQRQVAEEKVSSV